MRIGGEGGQGRAIKVWDQREFRNLDNKVELGTRNIKVALRRLRRFAREGAAEELDLDETIDGTARKGWLDIRMRPERHNAVKLLLFLDVGGSMDPHIKLCEELFSAATSRVQESRILLLPQLPLRERCGRTIAAAPAERTPTWDVLHKYGHDYKFVFVGDASMSPYEITHAGGSVEHYNEEAGAAWLQRLTTTYPAAVWLNPVPEQYWSYTSSIQVVRDADAGPHVPADAGGAGRGDADAEPEKLSSVEQVGARSSAQACSSGTVSASRSPGVARPDRRPIRAARGRR